MKNIFKNLNVLVTGGTGSIGSEVVKKLLSYNCKSIRVLGSDENGLHNLSLSIDNSTNDFFKRMKKNNIRFIYGDITDYNRMLLACQDVDIVIHAAALKHVPICEYNPFEATKVNVTGTQNLIRASLSNKVKKFILISTDKVVDTTTCLGATKLLAEKIVLNSNLNKGKNKISFSVVRFGNVIGTRGSVLPKFIYQVNNNKTITLTDKNTTRFFVTVSDAVDGIIDAIRLMKGGEIFIPNTIYSIKIYDLALVIKKYFNSKSDILITGMRVGEKIHESIITYSEFEDLKIFNNLFVLDKFNVHKIKKIKKKINYFNSKTANILNQTQILKYLKSNNLLMINN